MEQGSTLPRSSRVGSGTRQNGATEPCEECPNSKVAQVLVLH